MLYKVLLAGFSVFVVFLFISTSPASAEVATSNCVILKVGDGSTQPLPPECATTRSGATCPPNEPKYVCAYRQIVDHSVHADGSYWGFHAATSTWRGHLGVDLIARGNIPIYALENGTIIESYNDSGCGNIVKIQDTSGRRHLHCHMIRPGIAKNTVVKRGDIIGNVGHTGGNTSATDHVHYQVTNNSGAWADPALILKNWPTY